MGILKQIFGDKEEQQHGGNVAVETPPCPHTALSQHWDQPEDMGKAELARYQCESCGESFSFTEAQAFLEQIPAALAINEQEPTANDNQEPKM